MRLFAEVVAAGSLTSAAQRLGVRKSTVSRRIQALEERLGTRLLERNSRHLRLTDVGRSYHAECVRLVSEANRVNRAVRDARGTPQGTLRVATFELLGELLTPLIAEFLLRHLQVRVELSLTDSQVDLIAEEYDLALRTGPLADSSLVARRLGTLRTGYYASPGYLLRRGTPKTPSDLGAHECVLVAERGSDEVWFFTGPRAPSTVAVEGRLRVPTLRAGHGAARAGLGIVRLPTWAVREDLASGALVPVLEPVTPGGAPVFAVHPSARQVPAKVRAFLDLISERRAALPWDEGA